MDDIFWVEDNFDTVKMKLYNGIGNALNPHVIKIECFGGTGNTDILNLKYKISGYDPGNAVQEYNGINATGRLKAGKLIFWDLFLAGVHGHTVSYYDDMTYYRDRVCDVTNEETHV